MEKKEQSCRLAAHIMASLIARLWARFCAKRAPISIMIIGLDNSGKTSILNHLASLNHQPSCSNAAAPRQATASSSSSLNHEQSGAIGKKSSIKRQHSTSRDCDRITNQQASFNSNNTIITHKDDSTTNNCDNKDSNTISCGTSGAGGACNNNIMPTIGYNYERVQYRNLCLTVLDFSGQNRYRNLWQEFYNAVDGIVFVVDSSDLIRLVVVRDELETMLSHPYFDTLNDDLSARGIMNNNNNRNNYAQKQITISQGKLIQSPLDTTTSAVLRSKGQMSQLTPGGAVNVRQNNSLTNNNTTNNNKKNTASRQRRTKIPILFMANKADMANSVDTEVIVKALNLNQLATNRHPWFIQATSVNLSQGIVDGFDWLLSELSLLADC